MAAIAANILLALAVVACGGSSTPSSLGSRIGPALAAAFAAADRERAPWRCASADGPTLVDETLQLGDRTWKLAGHAVTYSGTSPVAIGVIADAGGAAPATIAALGRLRSLLDAVDVVIALGGMGATQAELEATLGTLAERPTRLLVAIPGDLESVAAQAAAIAALRARGRIVIDGRLARRIELPGVTIATVPGAIAATRLFAGADGCGYRAGDVAALLGDLAGRPNLRVLACAEAPRVRSGGEPAGELALTPAHEIDVVLHGPVGDRGSPARSGVRDGGRTPLTPGTSDATTRLPGPRRAPSAGVLTVDRDGWSWKLLVDAPPTDR